MLAESDLSAVLRSERRYLLRMATQKLRDGDLAEDVVQETLLSAVVGFEGFAGRATVKTWLVSILKNKIVDAIRHKTRLPSQVVWEDDHDFEGLDSRFGDGERTLPASVCGDPESQCSQRQFFAAFESCLERLPAKTARAFVMRELMGLESDEICQALSVTPNHFWVIVYRARKALRRSLEQEGFAPALTARATRTRDCSRDDIVHRA